MRPRLPLQIIFQRFRYFDVARFVVNITIKVKEKRLDSNIESKSSNNTYLNIIKILFLLLIFYFQYKDHQMQKFSRNVDLRKHDFLSQEKLFLFLINLFIPLSFMKITSYNFY